MRITRINIVMSKHRINLVHTRLLMASCQYSCNLAWYQITNFSHQIKKKDLNKDLIRLIDTQRR